MGDFSNKETGSSENWNMAIATLKRLSLLLDSCFISAQREDFINWFKTLFSLRRHLIPFMQKKEIDEIQDKFNSLPKGWRLHNGLTNPNCVRDVHKILDEIEIQFLIIMKREGLLMPKSDDPKFAING